MSGIDEQKTAISALAAVDFPVVMVTVKWSNVVDDGTCSHFRCRDTIANQQRETLCHMKRP